MKKSMTLIFLALLMNTQSRATNIDSVVTWSYYQGWYKAARSFYHYSGNKLDSIVTWSYNQGWYKSARTQFYGTATKTDSTYTWSYYQGWYHSGRSYYSYTGLNIDSIRTWSYNQGWYYSSRSYYKYSGNCIDSVNAYTYYQGWYHSGRSRYYNQGNCNTDSVHTAAYYQGWYDAARDYYYYSATAGIKIESSNAHQLKASPNPANDHFTLQLTPDHGNLTSLQLFSTDLKEFRADFTIDRTGQVRVNTANLPAGLIFYRLGTDKSTYTGKLIKQ